MQGFSLIKFSDEFAVSRAMQEHTIHLVFCLAAGEEREDAHKVCEINESVLVQVKEMEDMVREFL